MGQAVRVAHCPIPWKRDVAVNKEGTKMLEIDVIEPSSRTLRNPIVLVPKLDGSVRFCIDFQEVNKIAKFDAYPMPRLDILLSQLGEIQYLSALDLTKGYWQIPLRPQDHPKTAFATPNGLFHFKVMPSSESLAPELRNN